MQLCINEMMINNQGELPDHIATCAEHGISCMEICKLNLMSYLRRGGTLEDLKRFFLQSHVKPVCLNSIESITFNGKRGMRVLAESSEFLFFVCRSIGCDCVEIIASFKAPTESEEDIRKETVQSVRQLSEIAKPYGIRLALEYMGVATSSVKTFRQALSIIDEAGCDNAGILLDTWHHYAGGSSAEDISEEQRDRIFMVHVSDCPKRSPLQALRNESLMPGDGEADVCAMLEKLKRTGYDGPMSVEVMNPELRVLSADKLIERSKESMKAFLEKSNASL